MNIAGQTALHYAAYKIGTESLQIIELLSKFGADLNIKNSLGQTALHYACQSGDIAVVEFLIKCKANLNALTTSHELPLHFAVGHNHEDIVSLLLHHPVVVPTTVLDLETTPEIEQLLYAYISGEKLKKVRPKKYANLTVDLNAAEQAKPSVIVTPVTPMTPLMKSIPSTGPIFPIFEQPQQENKS